LATIEPSDIVDVVVVVTPDLHGDERGIFIETYRRQWFPGGREMLQGNRGDRKAGAVVGLHYHLHQADYWYVPFGSARVVLHDRRQGSPTDGATQCLDLGEVDGADNNHLGVYIPPGVAHGFASLTDMTILGGTIPQLDFDATMAADTAHVTADGSFAGFDPAMASGRQDLQGKVGGTLTVDATVSNVSAGITPDSVEADAA
jgi:dTDP-4-dehydrorhamnose 3,5-epimerase-like enzyme